MAAEKEIKAKEIVKDIISGIGDNELMHKYRLTFRGLQSVYRRLVDANLVDAALLEGRIIPQLHTETTIIARLPRKEIYLPLPVHELDNPSRQGMVSNLTDRGIGVKGLRARVDEVKTLVMRPEKLFQLSPFILSAKCRWVKPSDQEQEIQAGFEIIYIVHEELQKLRNLIETLDYLYRW
jgi:hypothetical protein